MYSNCIDSVSNGQATDVLDSNSTLSDDNCGENHHNSKAEPAATLPVIEGLEPEHVKEFLGRGFNEIQILKMVSEGLRSVDANDAWKEYGFRQWDGAKYIMSSGWLYRSKASGFIQFAPDDRDLMSKYLNQKGYKAIIDIPPGCEWVTEGIVDAYCGRFFGGEPIGIAAGVSHYKAAPEGGGLSWLFDSDGWGNPQVFRNLVHAALWTGGKIQLVPDCTSKRKDGLEEFFKSGKNKDDFKSLLESAYKPKEFLFELATRWRGVEPAKLGEWVRGVVSLAVELADEKILSVADQKILYSSLAKVDGVTLSVLKDLDKHERMARDKKTGKPEDLCRFLAQKQAIAGATGDRLRLNLLTKNIEFEGSEVNPGRYKTFVAEQINADIPREDCLELLGALAEDHSYNPVVEYLERVYAEYKDKSALLDNAASRLLHPSDGRTIYDTYLKKWMVGAVARAFNPGCKFDHVLLLQGKQGLFKSTFFRTLAGDAFFDDNLADLSNIKDELLLLHQAWIHEWAEFDRVSGKREVSIIKAFITRTEDRFRAPYDRAVRAHKRSSVLAGTVNENQFLVDEENRRFWIIPIGAPIDIEGVRAERDRLWAEAVALYKRGEMPTLTREETEVNIAINAHHRLEDTWELPLVKFLSNPTHTRRNSEGDRFFLMADAIERGLGIELSRQDRRTQGRVRKILTKLGCASAGTVRLGGSSPVRCWRYPKPRDEDVTGTSQPYPARLSGISDSNETEGRYGDVTGTSQPYPARLSDTSVTSVTPNSLEALEIKNKDTESIPTTNPPSEFSVSGGVWGEKDVTDVTPLPSKGSSGSESVTSSQGTSQPYPARLSGISDSSETEGRYGDVTGADRLEPATHKGVTPVTSLDSTPSDALSIGVGSRIVYRAVNGELAQGEITGRGSVGDHWVIDDYQATVLPEQIIELLAAPNTPQQKTAKPLIM